MTGGPLCPSGCRVRFPTGTRGRSLVPSGDVSFLLISCVVYTHFSHAFVPLGGERFFSSVSHVTTS